MEKYEEYVPSEKKMSCNMCGGDLKHYNYNGTFIWVCQACPNIQFELWSETDVIELQEFFKTMNSWRKSQ